MVWPVTLTANADVLKFIYEQGITRILEPGNTYTELHQGVALEVRHWLERNGINNADNITNTAVYALPATYLFWSKVVHARDLEQSKSYLGQYLALMRGIRANLGTNNDPASSGTVAKTLVIKQGSRYYTRRRAGAIFRDYRSAR